MAGFNNWRSNFESNPSVVDSFMLSSSCATAAYSFTEEDQYFVVFQSIEPESDNSLNVHVNVTFHRTKYAVDRDQYVEKRHFNASITSSVLTSFNGNTHILLVYGNSSESPEYWNNIQLDVDVNCEPRIWFYVVITIGPVVVTLLCVVCITCCICCVCRSKKKSEDRSPLLRDWDDPGTHHHSYYQYSERSRRLDPLTELAIATPESSNPHIAQFKEDLKQPSFQDEQLSFGSPKFSTFKP